MNRLNVLHRASRLALMALVITSCADDASKPDAYGHIEATEITISAETTGPVVWVGVDDGATAEAGQLLAVVDTTSLALRHAQLTAQRAAAASRRAQIDAQEAVYREQAGVLNVERERLTSLIEGGAATGKQRDDVEGQWRILQKQIESLDPQRASLRSELSVIDAQISQNDDLIKRSSVRSPITGHVITRFIEPGEFVAIGKPLFTLAKLDTVTMKAYVSGDQLPTLTLNQSVTVVSDGGDGTYKDFPGTIYSIASRAEFAPRNLQTREDRVNFVYAIEIRVPNDGTLKIGMPVDVRFN